MRNFLAIISVLLSAGGLAYAENPIKMVTYFPVPYASYNRVDVGGNANAQLDIGLLSGSSQLTLGNSSISNSAGLEVKNGTNLDAGTVSITATTFSITGDNGINFPKYASVSDATPPQLKLKNADIGNFYGNTLKATNVSAPKMMLFDKTFPAGNSTGMSNDKICKESFQWKKLKLGKGNTEALYLMCGEEQRCEPPDGRTTKSENCKWSGSLEYTWDYDQCKYVKTGGQCYKWIWVGPSSESGYVALTTTNISALIGAHGVSTRERCIEVVIMREANNHCNNNSNQGYFWEMYDGNCESGVGIGNACSEYQAAKTCYKCNSHAGTMGPTAPYMTAGPGNNETFSQWLSRQSSVTVYQYQERWDCVRSLVDE